MMEEVLKGFHARQAPHSLNHELLIKKNPVYFLKFVLYLFPANMKLEEKGSIPLSRKRDNCSEKILSHKRQSPVLGGPLVKY